MAHYKERLLAITGTKDVYELESLTPSVQWTMRYTSSVGKKPFALYETVYFKIGNNVSTSE